MKLQHQTTFGGPKAEPAERGNCWATCIACLLGIDVAEVPNFVAFEDFFGEAQRWLARRGLALAQVRTDPAEWSPDYAHVVTIAGGPGPRGYDHCVLWQHGKLLHDPHPSGAGILRAETFEFLVVVDADAFASIARLAP